MVVRLSGRAIEASEEQLRKAPSPRAVNGEALGGSGRASEAREEHYSRRRRLCPGLFMITMSTHDYSEKHLFMSMITLKLICS